MTTTANTISDEQLVQGTLAGDRSAFAAIVRRYQSLVCSITYNATGSLSLSEDLAQETFLAAWKELPELREPARLRSWLCAITRFLVGKEYRRLGREPLHAAESLDAAQELASPIPSPAAQAVSREEESILWRALERIPAGYREPLILFYREEKSVDRVATELELSEDAVKQRLSRGRKLLQEEVMAFVEGTLSRSGPKQDFSLAVMALLPSAPMATAGAGMAGKGATAVKSGFLAVALPWLGVAAGILVGWLSSRSAPTARERRFQRLSVFVMLGFSLVWSAAGQFALYTLRQRYAWSSETFLWAELSLWWIYAVAIAAFAVYFIRGVKSMRQQIEREPGPPQFTGAPLTRGSSFAIVAGIYVASFSWLIYLALCAHDTLGAVVIAAIVALLLLIHALRGNGRTPAQSLQGAPGHTALAWGIVLVILNVRLPAWLAALRGVDLAEMHRVLPAWVIPSASLFLVLWVGVVAALTRSHSSPNTLEKR